MGFEGQDLCPDTDLLRDFSVVTVTVLKQEHAVVAFEVVEDDDDVSVISVLILSECF